MKNSFIFALLIFLSIIQNTKLKATEVFFPEIESYSIDSLSFSEIEPALTGYSENFQQILQKYRNIAIDVASYKKQDTIIIAELYQFQTQNDAFGVYTQFKKPGYPTEKIGVEAFYSNQFMVVLYGYFIIVVSTQSTDNAHTQLSKIANAMTSSFWACTAEPFEITFFPQANKINASERYYPAINEYLRELQGIFTCQYSNDYNTYEFFITSSTPVEQFTRLINEALKLNAEDGIFYFIESMNTGIMMKGELIFGVKGLTNEEIAGKKFSELYQNMIKNAAF